MRQVFSGALAIAVLLAACTQAPDRAGHASTAHTDHASGPASTARVPTAVGTGVVESVDAAAGTVTLSHEPIAGLGWPAMTMDFLAAAALSRQVKPGDRVRFGFHAQGARFVITRIEPAR